MSPNSSIFQHDHTIEVITHTMTCADLLNICSTIPHNFCFVSASTGAFLNDIYVSMDRIQLSILEKGEGQQHPPQTKQQILTVDDVLQILTYEKDMEVKDSTPVYFEDGDHPCPMPVQWMWIVQDNHPGPPLLMLGIMNHHQQRRQEQQQQQLIWPYLSNSSP